MATNKIGFNQSFEIYNADGTSFYGLVLKKATVDSVVMSLGDKITGDVFYKDNSLAVTMQEYVVYDNVKYVLVNPPTIVKEGLVSDNGELKGMTKYSFEFYHPMFILSNIPFSDVAVSDDEKQYLSESKTFAWIGYLEDFVTKLNKNLQSTEWVSVINPSMLAPQKDEKLSVLSEVLSFDNNYISDALKTAYDTWGVPFVIDTITKRGQYTYKDDNNVTKDYFDEGKKYVISWGLPSEEIFITKYKGDVPTDKYNGGYYYSDVEIKLKSGDVIEFYNHPLARLLSWEDKDTVIAESSPYQAEEDISVCAAMRGTMVTKFDYTISSLFVFRYGQGVGLKNNSRTPKNNKIVTRLFGYGSDKNIPYGYPQIVWNGNVGQKFTYGNAAGVYENVTIGGHVFPKVVSYPIYKGIFNGTYVELIKHPFTRKVLMPSSYEETLFNKISPYAKNGGVNENYDPDLSLVDYFDADSQYPNPIHLESPSCEYHQFEDIKPELGQVAIIDARPYDLDAEESISESDFTQTIDNVISSAQSEDRAALGNFKTAVLTYGGIEFDSDATGIHIHYSVRFDSKKNFTYASYVSDNLALSYIVFQGQGLPEPEWDDSYDVEKDSYPQSYFEITLPILDFDLYACASITEEMSIYMRSGACMGCTFAVQVNWDDYKKNFYNADGDFDPTPHTQEGDGHVRDVTKYPDSRQEEIKVIVQKDINTFGTIMPNLHQAILSGDEFVILGISLPYSYIVSAQERLDNASKAFMRENNVYHFEYPLKFDEYFLQKNASVLEQIIPNRAVRFNFAEQTLKLYVKQITKKFGDMPLPTYDITLTDNIEVVLNQIGQVEEDIKILSSALSTAETKPPTNATDDARTKLSRLYDDTAEGVIGFNSGLWAGSRVLSGIDKNGNGTLRSLVVNERVSSSVNDSSFQGTGFSIYKDENGKWNAVFDNITARRKFQTSILEAKKETFVDGSLNLSAANGVAKKVLCYNSEGYEIDFYSGQYRVEDVAYIKIFFIASDEDGNKVKNSWMVGDMALMQTFENTQSVTTDGVVVVRNRSWWRVVSETGTSSIPNSRDDREYAYIVVRNDYSSLSDTPAKVTVTDGTESVQAYAFDNSMWNDIPEIGDHVVQRGNVLYEDRRGVTVLSSTMNGEKSGGLDVYRGYGERTDTVANQFSPTKTPIHIAEDGMSVYSEFFNLETPNGSVLIKNGKIYLGANTTEIGGDLVIRGLLTEKYDYITYEDAHAFDDEAPQQWWEHHHIPICINMKSVKSVMVGAKNIAATSAEESLDNIQPSVIALPFYDSYFNNYAGEGKPYDFLELIQNELVIDLNSDIYAGYYMESGTRVSIINEHDKYMANWSQLIAEGERATTEAEATAWLQRAATVLNRMTVVCADPRWLASSNRWQVIGEDTAIYAKNDTEGANNPYDAAYFVCNGYTSRFLALLSGESVQLRSQVIKITQDQEGVKGREVLVWVVENATNFVPCNAELSAYYSKDTQGEEEEVISLNNILSNASFDPTAGNRGDSDCFLGNSLVRLISQRVGGDGIKLHI